MRVVLVLGLLLAAAASHASLITIEPDDYAAGANLSNSFRRFGISLSMVTLSAVGTNEYGVTIWEPSASRDVYSAPLIGDPIIRGEGARPNAATGERVFAWDPGSNDGTGWGDMRGASCLLNGCTGYEGSFIDHVLRLDFVTPVREISALGWFSSGDPTSMFAIDKDGNGTGSCVQGNLSLNDQSCATRFPTPDVNVTDPRVGWGKISIVSGEANITTVFIGGLLASRPIDRIIVDVPEPGTLALFGCALLGLAVRRRRLLKTKKDWHLAMGLFYKTRGSL
jgi:hypothetical protein